LLGVFYGIMVTFLQILTPLINSLGMECINQGIPVNFGLARGVGSVSYALISYVAGELVTRYNTTVIPILIIILYSFLLVFVLTFRFAKEKGININNKENNTKTKIATEIVGIQEQRRSGIHEKSTSFFVKYPKFLFLILGATITFISHNIINNFMFQIMEYHGGGSCEMGIAMGLAAGLELPTMIAFGYVIKKVSPGALLRISGIFFAMKAFMMFMAGSILTIYIAQSAQILGFALFVPASVYYVNELVEQKDRVKGQAYMTVTNTLGSIFGSLFGGFILDEKGVSVMLLVSFVMGIIGMLIIFGSINRTREKAII